MAADNQGTGATSRTAPGNWNSRWSKSRVGGRRGAEKLKTASEIFLFGAIGKETEVADALKGVWQDVKQKTADELISIQSHRALLAGCAIAIEKRHVAIINRNDTAIGDRDAVRVTAQILQDGLGR